MSAAKRKPWYDGLTEVEIDALPPIGYVEVIVDPYVDDAQPPAFGPVDSIMGRQPVLHLAPGGYCLYQRNGLGHHVTVGKRHVAGKTMEWANGFTEVKR